MAQMVRRLQSLMSILGTRLEQKVKDTFLSPLRDPALDYGFFFANLNTGMMSQLAQ